MNTLDAIKNRRSHRSYSSKPISLETVKQLIELANLAPSPMTRQNRHFVIVTNSETRLALKEAALNQQHVASASVVIVVVSPSDFVAPESLIEQCCDWGMDLWGVTANDYIGNQQFEDHYRMWRDRWDLQDAAVAIQTLLLAATEMGLASCWIGGFDEDAVRAVLHLPSDSRVHALVTLGYLLNSPEFPRRRRDVEELIHLESW